MVADGRGRSLGGIGNPLPSGDRVTVRRSVCADADTGLFGIPVGRNRFAVLHHRDGPAGAAPARTAAARRPGRPYAEESPDVLRIFSRRPAREIGVGLIQRDDFLDVHNRDGDDSRGGRQMNVRGAEAERSALQRRNGDFIVVLLRSKTI